MVNMYCEIQSTAVFLPKRFKLLRRLDASATGISLLSCIWSGYRCTDTFTVTDLVSDQVTHLPLTEYMPILGISVTGKSTASVHVLFAAIIQCMRDSFADTYDVTPITKLVFRNSSDAILHIKTSAEYATFSDKLTASALLRKEKRKENSDAQAREEKVKYDAESRAIAQACCTSHRVYLTTDQLNHLDTDNDIVQ